LAGSMPCQANNACASSHHCSNGIIAMLPKTDQPPLSGPGGMLV
jgi:hypothetical protein